MIRFVALFIVLLVVLFIAELTPPVQQALVVPWTALLADISAAIIRAYQPDVISYGKVIQDALTGNGVSIEAGCNGVEACVILIAGVLAYPASWRLRLAGIALGIVAIQAVNVLRVITLFHLSAWDSAFMQFAHLYLWPALIMLDVLVVWLLWVRHVARREAHHEALA